MSAQAYAEVFAAVRKPLPPQLIQGMFQAADVLAIALAAAVASWAETSPARTETYVYIVAVAIILSALIFRLNGCYSDRVLFSEVPRIRKVVFGWIAVIGLLLFIDFGLARTVPITRGWGFLFAASAMLLLAVERIVLGVLVNRLVHKGHVSQRSVIVGAGSIGRRFAARLNRLGEPRIKVVGFIDAGPSDPEKGTEQDAATIESYPVLGRMDDLVRLIREERIELVFVALASSPDGILDEVLERLAMLPVHVRLIPAMASVELSNRPISIIAGIPIIHVSDRPLSGWKRFAKAAEDRTIATLVLILVLPLILAIAVAIKLDSPGPVLFRQPRRGFNNKLFELYKFRTMYHDRTDHRCEVQTTRNDRRVTPVGRFLRRTSLDELPQFLNVLKGEMSIVGPRPHAVSTKAAGRLFEEVVREYPSRYRVKPGITGWAQVNGWRGETDTAEKLRKRIEYDLFYIENWSVMFDLWIMIRTIFVVFRDERAY